jgi:hypothetical protein
VSKKTRAKPFHRAGERKANILIVSESIQAMPLRSMAGPADAGCARGDIPVFIVLYSSIACPLATNLFLIRGTGSEKVCRMQPAGH